MYSFFKADFINCTWSVQLWIDKYHAATPVAREKQVWMPQGWGTTLSKWKLWLQWIVVSPSSGVKLKESTAGVDGQEGKKCLGLCTLRWGRNYPGVLTFHAQDTQSDSPMSISVKPSALMASIVLLSIVSRQRLASWGSSNKRAWKD